MDYAGDQASLARFQAQIGLCWSLVESITLYDSNTLKSSIITLRFWHCTECAEEPGIRATSDCSKFVII